MGGETPMTVTFAVVANQLRTEADLWRQWATEIRAPAATVDSLVLDVSAFLFSTPEVAQELRDEYEALRSFMCRVLAQAVSEFETMADALDRAAAVYEGNDRHAADSTGPIFAIFE
jgi:hypothetical protein